MHNVTHFYQLYANAIAATRGVIQICVDALHFIFACALFIEWWFLYFIELIKLVATPPIFVWARVND